MDRPGLPPADGRGPVRPEAMELFIGVLLVAVDLGLTALYRSQKHEAELKELQAANVSRQLEALRYQINPHFFMNTLNNIQSLIYTDPDKATEAVSEFSKLMRIVLYEGEAPTIPLSHELDYIRHYLSLMRLRYPESVRIEAALPRETDSAVVPPLLMASFVENAFKHGISYEAPSFVRLSLEMTQRRILFSCANSLHPARQKEQHGLGMENIRKRLDLLYDSDYALHIDEQPDSYRVLLDIPLTPKNEQA
jgi:LytS/YehU family sensor histidine kinase